MTGPAIGPGAVGLESAGSTCIMGSAAMASRDIGADPC